jgi:DNA-binding transcriptional ArsR family regulator
LERVLLVPQHHCRPINLYEHFKNMYVYGYPVDVFPVEPGAPPQALTRLTAALADSSRLRILRFLAGAPRTFTEVRKETGLAKSTVHHHLVTLRAAGLIRVQDLADGSARYSLRPAALNLLGARLGAYIEED